MKPRAALSRRKVRRKRSDVQVTVMMNERYERRARGKMGQGARPKGGLAKCIRNMMIILVLPARWARDVRDNSVGVMKGGWRRDLTEEGVEPHPGP